MRRRAATYFDFMACNIRHECQISRMPENKRTTGPNPIIRRSGNNGTPAHSSARELSAFLETARKLDPTSNGRLIFSLDATMSRQPTWDRACEIQASMFDTVGKVGGLSVQLVYFRGFGECRASRWVMNAAALRDLMTGIQCRGGHTQIKKVLQHANRETTRERVAALVFIGDAMEEDIDKLSHLAGELGMKNVKAFMFQEGHDPVAERAFREIARLTGGAWFRLGPNSSAQLAELLNAVAVYASGGRKALLTQKNRGARQLLEQLPSGAGGGAGRSQS
jgi:hypothetical protein